MTAIERHALEIELLLRRWEGVVTLRPTVDEILEHVEEMKVEERKLLERLGAAELGWI